MARTKRRQRSGGGKTRAPIRGQPRPTITPRMPKWLAVTIALVVVAVAYLYGPESGESAGVGIPSSGQPEAASPPVPTVAPGTVVALRRHDKTSFTQGLFVQNGTLYESTGLYGSSVLRTVDLETGTVIKETRLRKELFGEVRKNSGCVCLLPHTGALVKASVNAS